MSDQTQNPRGSLAVAAVSYSLSLVFVCIGLAKLWGPQLLTEQFAAWHFPPAFIYMVGVVEVVAGFLLMLPTTRAVGALLLAIIMIGAGATHFFAQQFAAMAVPAAIFLLVAWIMSKSDLPVGDTEEPEHSGTHREAAAH